MSTSLNSVNINTSNLITNTSNQLANTIVSQLSSKQNIITAGSGLSFSGNTLNSSWSSSGSIIYNNGGNVGIGITNPSTTLHVNGGLAITGSINANGTTGPFVIDPNYTSESYVRIWDGLELGGWLRTSGVVGIGTTSAQGNRLYVNGNMYVNGFLASANNIYINNVAQSKKVAHDANWSSTFWDSSLSRHRGVIPLSNLGVRLSGSNTQFYLIELLIHPGFFWGDVWYFSWNPVSYYVLSIRHDPVNASTGTSQHTVLEEGRISGGGFSETTLNATYNGTNLTVNIGVDADYIWAFGRRYDLTDLLAS